MKTLYLVSLGCPKNLVDSEVMLAALNAAGYQVLAEPDQADVLLVNTCGFIQSAAEEAVDVILELAALKKQDPGKLLVVTGCLVQRYGAELASALPEVDCFVGLDDFPGIAGLLAVRSDKQRLVTRSGSASFLMDSSLPRQLATPFFRAYLKVTEGCDNRCAYCMIPAIRGPLRSRDIADLVQEARLLEAQGVRELSLIAQDLSAFGRDLGMKHGLTALLEALLAKTDIPWLRLLYLYPSGVDEGLLSLMRGEPRIVPYLDVPMQHVSDTVLQAMGRRYRRRDLESFLDRVRSTLPDCALRTTFMVGFPGETDADVQALLEAISAWKLDHAGVFAYEDEEDCAAFKLPGKVEQAIREARRDAVMAAQAAVSAARLQEKIGRVLPVLVEGYSQESDLLLEGRTSFQAPEVDGCVYINEGEAEQGAIVPVHITEAHVYDLVGKVVENPRR